MRLWGIDPSLRNTGVAVLRVVNGVPVVEHATVISTKPAAKKRHTYQADDDVRCLREIGDRLNALAGDYPPDFLVSETLAAAKGQRAAMAMGMAFGAVVGWATSRRLMVVPVSARDAKQAATGDAAASKKDVAWGVTHKLGDLGEVLPSVTASRYEHAYDAAAVALAVAIVHRHHFLCSGLRFVNAGLVLATTGSTRTVGSV